MKTNKTLLKTIDTLNKELRLKNGVIEQLEDECNGLREYARTLEDSLYKRAEQVNNTSKPFFTYDKIYGEPK